VLLLSKAKISCAAFPSGQVLHARRNTERSRSLSCFVQFASCSSRQPPTSLKPLHSFRSLHYFSLPSPNTLAFRVHPLRVHVNTSRPSLGGRSLGRLSRFNPFRSAACISAAFDPPAALFCCARLRSLWVPARFLKIVIFPINLTPFVRSCIASAQDKAVIYCAGLGYIGRPRAGETPRSRPPTQSSTRGGSQNSKNLFNLLAMVLRLKFNSSIKFLLFLNFYFSSYK